MNCLKTKVVVDHINHNTLDNRRCNLRITTISQNNKNARIRKDNKSGFSGVRFEKEMWISRIRFDGKQIVLGRFNNKEDAIQARKEASIKYGYHENHGIII